MSAIYEIIGRLAVHSVWLLYGRQIRIATGFGLAALLVGGFLAAKREAPEG
jgi:hypothetical protein